MHLGAANAPKNIVLIHFGAKYDFWKNSKIFDFWTFFSEILKAGAAETAMNRGLLGGVRLKWGMKTQWRWRCDAQKCSGNEWWWIWNMPDGCREEICKKMNKLHL